LPSDSDFIEEFYRHLKRFSLHNNCYEFSYDFDHDLDLDLYNYFPFFAAWMGFKDKI